MTRGDVGPGILCVIDPQASAGRTLINDPGPEMFIVHGATVGWLGPGDAFLIVAVAHIGLEEWVLALGPRGELGWTWWNPTSDVVRLLSPG